MLHFQFSSQNSQKKHPEFFFLMFELPVQISRQSFLSTFTKKYLCKCKDAYFILQNKYVCINEDSFGAKILIDDCAFSENIFAIDSSDKSCNSRFALVEVPLCVCTIVNYNFLFLYCVYIEKCI